MNTSLKPGQDKEGAMMRDKILTIIFILFVASISTVYAANITYQYDDLHRLTKMEHENGPTIIYEYDKLGNRISKKVTSTIQDSDNDELPDNLEADSCTDPYDADTDDDGIIDGEEDANHNGSQDPGETDPCSIDTDGDGIQDGTELGYTDDDIGADTDTSVFQPDLDPSTTSDPLNSDTDGDGMSDGEEDSNANGRVDNGESDPTYDNLTKEHVLFQDDFDDGAMDLDKWTLSCHGKGCIEGVPGEAVEEESGVLSIRADATDRRGRLISQKIYIDPSKPIIFEKKTKVHYAESPYPSSWPGPYYKDKFSVEDEKSGTLLSLHYYNYHYQKDLYGFGFAEDNLLSPIWDSWFIERIIYDPVTGQAKYILNGEEKLTYDANSFEGNTIRLDLISGGWWTGHYTQLDYIKVFQTADNNDKDQDSLLDSVEQFSCTDPYDADTDDDGIPDGDEDANHNGQVDPGETDPCNPDTDGDGIQDGTEIGLTLDDIGPDTDTSVFQPDLDPRTTTDPLNEDTDGDGILDGEEDANQNGRVDAGETDPATAEQRIPGDVNGDGEVDLADVILALQFCCGLASDGDVHSRADVNGDNRIGLAEAVYALGKAVGDM
jgi:YD repeat-containing protein